jgi:2-hydroxy-3-keto-5-methylthiopentenyl-1-phosphate phosphatase
MAPVIRAVLFNLGDDAVADSIDIIANDVEIHPGDKWNIKFRHPTMYFIYSLPLVFFFTLRS